MINSKPIFLFFIGTILVLIGSSVTVIQNYNNTLGKSLMVFASNQQNDDDSNQINQGNEISNKYFEQEDSAEDLRNLTNPRNLDETIIGQDSFSQPRSDLNIYQSQNFGFKIAYPVSWEKTEESDTGFAYVVFISPFEGNEDKFNERLAVRVNDVDTNTTLRGYSDTYLRNIRNNPDSEVIGITDSSLSGSPAEKLVYILRQGENQFAILEQWTVRDNKVYQISFYSELEKYQTLLPMIEESINSLEIF